MRRYLLLLLPCLFVGCSKAPPQDSICSYEPLPASVNAPKGEGAIQIVAKIDGYYAVIGKDAKQVVSHSVNQTGTVKPGDYVVKINNSTHPVVIEEGKLTRCTIGGLMATGATDQYYYVIDPAAGKQLASARLGKAEGLFPGKYAVKVNNTTAPAEVKSGEITQVPTAILNVRGTTDEYYYVLDNAGTQLASSRLNSATALFPGPVTVKVNNSTAPVQPAAGQTAEVQTGALSVTGTTEEYYYVLNDQGTQLASAKLGKATSLVEGAYTVKVNNSPIPVKVEAGKTAEYKTGTLTQPGTGNEYYYVLDSKGTQLGSAKVGKPMALPAGTYTVKLENNSKTATVAAGQTATVK